MHIVSNDGNGCNERVVIRLTQRTDRAAYLALEAKAAWAARDLERFEVLDAELRAVLLSSQRIIE